MKVDFATVLTDLKNKPIPGSEGNLTLGEISCTALLTPYPEDDKLDPKEKVRRFKLATLASDGGEQELSLEDVVELKKLLGKFPPLIVGRAYEILDK